MSFVKNMSYSRKFQWKLKELMKNQKSSTPKAMKVFHTSKQLSALIQNICIQTVRVQHFCHFISLYSTASST